MMELEHSKIEVTFDQFCTLMTLIRRQADPDTGLIEDKAVESIIHEWFDADGVCRHSWDVTVRSHRDYIIYIRKCSSCGVKEYGTPTCDMIWAHDSWQLENAIEDMCKKESE